MEIEAEMRMPDRIAGRAAGSTILRMISQRLMKRGSSAIVGIGKMVATSGAMPARA